MLPRLAATPQPAQAPEGYYSIGVWADENTLVLTYSPDPADASANDLVVVDLITGARLAGPSWQNKNCKSGHIVRLQRMQPMKIGILIQCSQPVPGKRHDTQIYLWDMRDDSLTLFNRYPHGFGVGDFAFAPVLAVGLQEGDAQTLTPKLYTVTIGQPATQIFTDTFKAGRPAWSVDGERIAYALSQETPPERSSIFTGLVAIDNALDQPWTIYTDAPDFSDSTLVIDRAVMVGSTRFSPDRRFLAFTANEYLGNKGVFAVNLRTLEVTQLWNENVAFDWSPSGDKMLFMVNKFDITESLAKKPLILDVTGLE